MDAATHTIEVTTANFQDEVLARSMRVPVLVDFWASWCEPCKQLTPILEKLALEYGGGFVLAKVDVDAEQQLAGYLGIRSVPTLMLVRDGQIVDGIPGAVPEAQLRQFLQHHRIEPAPAAEPAEAVEVALSPQEQVETLRAALSASPDNHELQLDLALALLRAAQPDEAERLLAGLPASLEADDRARRARAQLDFAKRVRQAPPRAELERRVAADPDDHEARHLLGTRLIAEGDGGAGLDQYLEMLRRDRQFGDGLARKALLEAFNVIDDDALVAGCRRRMAAILF